MSTGATQTIYIKNLDDGVRKEELRRTLYILACEFGTVLDVSVAKTAKSRGQAWVTFRTDQEAVFALQQLQSTSVYGKPMIVQYAKQGSAVVNPQVLRRNTKAVATKKAAVSAIAAEVKALLAGKRVAAL